MSTQNEVRAIEALIHAYAEALNSGNSKVIGGFYTNDGAILPNGHNTVSKKQLDSISGEFLKKNKFRIEFKISNISLTGESAIVESIATTKTTAPGSQSVDKTTRDLFALRKAEAGWKIYRYIFNTSK